MEKRRTWIDGMKGIAICGVVMIHSGGSSLPSVWGRIGDIGKNGVQVFLLISSCLVFGSMERAFAKGMTAKSIRNWLVRKFLKLIPLYYLAILVYGVLTGGSSYWLGAEGHITFFNVLAHVFFVHGFFPHYADSIIGVEWYLGVLAIFYVIAPLLYRIVTNLYRALITWIIGTLSCTWLVYIVGKCIPDVIDAEIYYSYVSTFSFFSQFSVLLLGIVLFYLMKIIDNRSDEKDCVMTSYALLLLGCVMIGGMALGLNSILGINEVGLFGLCFLVIAISQCMHSCKIIDNPFFRYLGKYSFPIYLFHYLFIYAYDSKIHFDFGQDIANWLVKYICVLGGTALFAYLISNYFENPITKRMLRGSHET